MSDNVSESQSVHSQGDGRPAKRQKLAQPRNVASSSNSDGSRMKPGPSRSSAGLDQSLLAANGESVSSHDNSTHLTSPSVTHCDDPIGATVNLAKTITIQCKAPPNPPTDISSNRLDYDVLLYQRDIILRGFYALQTLHARESQKHAPRQAHGRLQQELEAKERRLKQALVQRDASMAEQEKLSHQLNAAVDNNDLLRRDLKAAEDELQMARTYRDKSRLKRQALRDELRDTKAELAAVREQLTVAHGKLNATRASGSDIVQSSSSPLDDPLMSELEATLDAVKHDASQREGKLVRMSELEVQVTEMQAEREELMSWKQRAILLEGEVKARAEEAAQWQQRFEARGARLSAVVREMNELRAQIG